MLAFNREQGLRRRVYICAVILGIALLMFWRHLTADQRQGGKTLFLITHSATDEEYTDNLRFLIKHGMGGSDKDLREYVIIIQQVSASSDGEKEPFAHLPRLPSDCKARYVLHKNLCFDWGTFGWALFNLNLDIKAYQHFIFLNTSIRGPFLPSYWPQDKHWSELFIARITDQVKLVGSTISCEGAHEFGGVNGRGRHNPHVQSYVLATDQVGLQVLLQDRHVFECHKDISDAVFYAEIGSSLAVFRAGYTIDSLMLRYRNVDWTNPANWQCNSNLNPYADFAYDGLFLNPLEVVFVKVKRFQREANWGSARLADAYSGWMDQEKAPGVVNSNTLMVNPLSLRLGRVIEMVLRGPACFDFDSYLVASPDVDASSREAIWTHFCLEDQFSGRKFWFTCHNPLKNDTVSADIVRWLVEITRQAIDPAVYRPKTEVRTVESLSASHHTSKTLAIG